MLDFTTFFASIQWPHDSVTREKIDLTPVKTAAEDKFFAYLSLLCISFRMLCDTTESKNIFSKNLAT